ncbi:hypothetical protein V8D89_000818 [Ganoderma adspersum]
MATTTVRAKPARTASKRASSANANVNSNTTLTLHLNLGADASSRATNVVGTNATRRAKPQGSQAQWYSGVHVFTASAQTRGQNGRPAQTATGAASSPPNQPRQNRPRAQQTNCPGAGAANGNGHNNAPRPQQQRQPSSGQSAGARSGNGNGGNGYVPRATSTPRQQPTRQDAQRKVASRLPATTTTVQSPNRTTHLSPIRHCLLPRDDCVNLKTSSWVHKPELDEEDRDAQHIYRQNRCFSQMLLWTP